MLLGLIINWLCWLLPLLFALGAAILGYLIAKNLGWQKINSLNYDIGNKNNEYLSLKSEYNGSVVNFNNLNRDFSKLKNENDS